MQDDIALFVVLVGMLIVLLPSVLHSPGKMLPLQGLLHHNYYIYLLAFFLHPFEPNP
jgi:hypothetical protein